MRRRPRRETVLRCPHCLSPDVLTEVTLFSGARYHCKKCGYQGAVILEEDADSVSAPPTTAPPSSEGT